MDRAYLKIVEELQQLGLEVRWEIETVKIVMPKVGTPKYVYSKVCLFLSPPVLMQGGLLCIALRLSVCHWTKIH